MIPKLSIPFLRARCGAVQVTPVIITCISWLSAVPSLVGAELWGLEEAGLVTTVAQKEGDKQGEP